MKKSDFYYNLPEELIAQTPVTPRDHSRLMVVDRESGAITHRHFYNLCDILQKGDLLVMNDSRVLPARLYGEKVDNGTFIEFLLLEQKGDKLWEIICRPGKKAKVGTLGKLMIAFMGYSLVSTLWSTTKFSTLATAGLWWGLFLIQVMINNLVRTRKKIDRILAAMSLSGAINGFVAILQICSYTLFKYDYIKKSQVFVTPFYKPLDKAVYTWLPFDIDTTLWWDSRASGFFSNPNLLATYLMIVYPISIYLFLNTKGKKHKILYFMMNVLISGGISATLTRGGCVIAIVGWLFMFIVLFKQHKKPLLEIFVPTVLVIIPSLLTRLYLKQEVQEAKL